MSPVLVFESWLERELWMRIAIGLMTTSVVTNLCAFEAADRAVREFRQRNEKLAGTITPE